MYNDFCRISYFFSQAAELVCKEILNSTIQAITQLFNIGAPKDCLISSVIMNDLELQRKIN